MQERVSNNKLHSCSLSCSIIIQYSFRQFKFILRILEISFLVTPKRLAPEEVILQERMRKWQIYIVPGRNVVTIWMKWVEIFCVYTENDTSIGQEQSWVDVRDLCRGRYFSPSLPDRGPTGIWNLAHSISDPRAEISGILVMVRRSGTTSRGTTYWFHCFSFPMSSLSSLRMTWCAYQSQEKKR